MNTLFSYIDTLGNNQQAVIFIIVTLSMIFIPLILVAFAGTYLGLKGVVGVVILTAGFAFYVAGQIDQVEKDE